MQMGTEWLIDAEGCRAEALRDGETLRRLCEQIIADLELHVVGEGTWHRFPWPGGVTGLYLLTESHLACHTYPEHGTATFNLYCCRPRPCWSWAERLREWLGAGQVTIRAAVRGRLEGELTKEAAEPVATSGPLVTATSEAACRYEEQEVSHP